MIWKMLLKTWYFISAKYYGLKAWVLLQLLHIGSFFNDDAKRYYKVAEYRWRQSRLR